MYNILRIRQLKSVGLQITGVISVSETSAFMTIPTVTFSTVEHQLVKGRSEWFNQPTFYTAGQQVTVYYNVNDPSQFIIYSVYRQRFNYWLLIGGMIVITIGLVLLGRAS